MTQSVCRKRGATIRSALFQLLPTAALFVLFAAVGVVHVTSRVMVVHVGYRLSALEQQRTDLVREHEHLKLELATLKSPSRLERIARDQLGMAPPAAGAVISLKASRSVSSAEAALIQAQPGEVALANRSLPR